MPPTDDQKILLHIANQAMKAGKDLSWITRDDLLNGKLCPVGSGMRLVWAALTMPKGVLEWSEDEQSFRLSDMSVQMIAAS